MSAREPREEPKYVISVAARMVELHPQTLRHYESLGLVRPTRSRGNRRLYSERDLERLRLICRLTGDLGVNLAGVEVILNMTEQLRRVKEEMARREEHLLAEIVRLKRMIRRQSSDSEIVPFMPPLPPDSGKGGTEWSSDRR